MAVNAPVPSPVIVTPAPASPANTDQMNLLVHAGLTALILLMTVVLLISFQNAPSFSTVLSNLLPMDALVIGYFFGRQS